MALLYNVIPQTRKNLEQIVTQLIKKLRLLPEGKRTGRPPAISYEDAIVWGLYWHQSTRATKKSVYDDFTDAIPCSYKTFVVSLNKVATIVAFILFYLMEMGRERQYLVKYTDATDIPVCLSKNAKKHKTMSGRLLGDTLEKGIISASN